MVDRLRHPIEEEASAEATREEHAEPEVQKLVKKILQKKAEGPFPPPQVGQLLLAAIFRTLLAKNCTLCQD